MKFAATALALAASVATVAANTVTFVTLDDVTRTIVFTASAGGEALESVTVNSKANTTVTFPTGYIGNFYAVKEGATDTPGMLGEVTFNGWNGLTYFDVSAIVDPNDKDNVKQMWPSSSLSPISGCEVFPCDNAYYLPDDVQTKVTEEVDLITTLGTAN